MILKHAVNQVVRSITRLTDGIETGNFPPLKTGKNSRNREITGKRQPIADHALVMAAKVYFDLVIRMVSSVSI